MKAVTYDFWNTLMWESPGAMRSLRRTTIEMVIEDLGLELETEEIERELGVISDRHQAHWKRGEMYLPAHGVEHFGEALAGGSLPSEHREKLGEAVLLLSARPELNVAEGVGETLRELKSAGIKLGIICDVGLTPSTVLRDSLDRAGLLELFDGWAFSDDVGHYKPSAAIFEHALGQLGVEPGDAAHVGDLRRTDVAGARAMGMTSVRYHGVADDPEDGAPDADHVIGGHLEILSLL
jgi:FMN phosphatase YigB (HAD superfamily)